jgi:hypothetical protein
VAKVLDMVGHLITFVDHLFDALLQVHPDALVEHHAAVVNVPPLVVRVAEAVRAAREQLQTAGGGAVRTDGKIDGQEHAE